VKARPHPAFGVESFRLDRKAAAFHFDLPSDRQMLSVLSSFQVMWLTAWPGSLRRLIDAET
jgi:hypothetical protein